MVMVSQSWTETTGAIQSCTAQLAGGPGPGRHTQQNCVVTWPDGATTRTGSIVLTGAVTHPGQSVRLRVHGNDVAVPTPAWEGYLAVGIGVVLIAGGAVVAVRRSNSTSSAPPKS